MNTLLSFLFKNGIYPTLYFRIACCLFAAHIIVSFGEKENILELIQLIYYYNALGASFVIAFVISEFVWLLNSYLDKYLSWREPAKRLLLQFLVGVLLSVCIAIALGAIYFKINHLTIFSAGYFTYDFTVILCFIALVNGYYILANLYGIKILNRQKKISNTLQPVVVSPIRNDEPVILYSDDKICWALLADGQKILWTKTLKASMAHFLSDDYFQINRSEIVNRACIRSYLPGESRTLRLILHEPFESTAYQVSQRNVVEFKRWFELGRKSS